MFFPFRLHATPGIVIAAGSLPFIMQAASSDYCPFTFAHNYIIDFGVPKQAVRHVGSVPSTNHNLAVRQNFFDGFCGFDAG